MTVATTLQEGFDELLSRASRTVRIDYYNLVYDSVYDEPVNLIQSGNTLFVSGIILPTDLRKGTSDALLMEQGKITNGDIKLFLSGGISINNDNQKIQFQLGSPTGPAYSLIPDGTVTPQVNGVDIYKKIYLRKLTGSLI